MAAPDASPTGDALVTISCDPNLPLEERMELLAYAFAKAVNADRLQRIVEWDVANGRVRFILSPKGFRRQPRGSVGACLEDVVTTEMQAL